MHLIDEGGAEDGERQAEGIYIHIYIYFGTYICSRTPAQIAFGRRSPSRTIIQASDGSEEEETREEQQTPQSSSSSSCSSRSFNSGIHTAEAEGGSAARQGGGALPELESLVVLRCRGQVADVPRELLGSVPRYRTVHFLPVFASSSSGDIRRPLTFCT